MTTAKPSKLQKLRLVSATSKRSRTAKAILKDEFGDSFDPVIELMRIGLTTDNERLKAKCFREAARFVHPQLKSSEVQQNIVTHEIGFSNVELANRLSKFVEDKQK